MSPLRFEPATMRFTERNFLASFSSSVYYPLVQWLSGRTAQGPWGSCLFHSLACTRPTTWAPFIQTAASHGLDYSSALPVPAIKTDVSIPSWALGSLWSSLWFMQCCDLPLTQWMSFFPRNHFPEPCIWIPRSKLRSMNLWPFGQSGKV